MANRSSKQSDLPATAAALVAGVRLTPQMLMMFRAFLGSLQRTKLVLMGVAISPSSSPRPSAKLGSTHGTNPSTMRSPAKI